jgi:hypothetical protein
MHLRTVNIAGDALRNACRWIAPFIGFWSPALLIRAARLDDIKNNDFLGRARVATMDSSLAKRLYDWCLRILERELACLSGPIEIDSLQESLLLLLPEVLSRLVFRVEATDLKKTFSLFLRFHGQALVRSHIRLHKTCEPWFKRSFEAANGELLLEWLPELIKSTLFEQRVHPNIPADCTWPDPMQHFPSVRAREAISRHLDLVAKINQATDWLLTRALSESGESWNRAIVRLFNICDIKVMTPDQERQFGDLLWCRKTTNKLPDVPNIRLLGYFLLPVPLGVDVHSAVKNHILSLDAELSIKEAADATKSIIAFCGLTCKGVTWTPQESRTLYLKARAWWVTNREKFKPRPPNAPFWPQMNDSKTNTLKKLGKFFARVILPDMDLSNDDDRQQLAEWLGEIRAVGVFPTIALPYVLIQSSGDAARIGETVVTDLNSDVEDAVVAAAHATRYWLHLSAVGRVSSTPAGLIASLIDRVVFRRKAGIDSCLSNLSYLLVEQPEQINSQQAALIASSLVGWSHAIILPLQNEHGGDYSESERPDLRLLVGRLAGSLALWYGKVIPGGFEPSPIALWRNLCASDSMPAVRRSFDELRSLVH